MSGSFERGPRPRLKKRGLEEAGKVWIKNDKKRDDRLTVETVEQHLKRSYELRGIGEKYVRIFHGYRMLHEGVPPLSEDKILENATRFGELIDFWANNYQDNPKKVDEIARDTVKKLLDDGK